MTEIAVHVDRLRLRVHGLDEGAARHFARLVAQQLVPTLTPAPGNGSIANLAASVPPDDSLETTAAAVAREISRALQAPRLPDGAP